MTLFEYIPVNVSENIIVLLNNFYDIYDMYLMYISMALNG